MVEYKSLTENSTSILKREREKDRETERDRERESPREFIDVWKDVSLRLILKDKGGKRDCLQFCWF